MGDNIWSREGADDFELACPNCGATLINGRCAECRTIYHHDDGPHAGAPEPEPTGPESGETDARVADPPTEHVPPSFIGFDERDTAAEPASGDRSRWSAVLAVAVVLVVAVGLSLFVRGRGDRSDAAPRFGVVRSPEQLEQLFEYRTSGAVAAVAGSTETTFVLIDRDRDNLVVLNADGEQIGSATVPGDRLALDAYLDIAVVFERGMVRAIDATGATLWETEGDAAEFVAENEVLVYNDRPDSPVEDYEVFGARSGRTLRELDTQYKVPAIDAEFFAERRRGEVELFDRRLRLIQSFSALATNHWYYDGEYMVTAPGNRLRLHSLTGVSRECSLDEMDTISEVMPVGVGEYVVNGYSEGTQIAQRVNCSGNAGTLEVIWSEPNAWTTKFVGDLTIVQRHDTATFHAFDAAGDEIEFEVTRLIDVSESAQHTYRVHAMGSGGLPLHRLVRVDAEVDWMIDYPDQRGEQAWLIDGAVVVAERSGDHTTLRFLGDG